MGKRKKAPLGTAPTDIPWSFAERVLRLLSAHGVEFLLAGDLAVLLQGAPDLTQGLILWYRPTSDNIDRLVAALSPLHPVSRARGLPFAASSLRESALPGWLIDGHLVQLLDALPSLDTHEACLARARPLDLGDTTVAVLSLADLCAVQASPRLPAALRMSPWLEGRENQTVELPLRPPVWRFPESMFEGVHHQRFRESWYARHLDAMGEPPLATLSAAGSSHLRALVLPTWHHPVCVRIDHDEHQTRLTATRLSGQGGHDPGTIAWQRRATVSPRTWADCVRQLPPLPRPPPDRRTLTLDGTVWLLEHLADGVHQGAQVTSPRPHDPLRQSVERLLALVSIQMPREHSSR